MAEYFDGGNYKIHEMILVNYRGQTTDISGLFVYLEVYEDIFSTTVSAKIGIEDSVDLFQNFPIIGKEKLILSYSTTGFDKVRIELDVYSVPNREQIKIKHQTYTMSFMSTEGMANQYTTVRRSLSGNIGDNVKSILSTELGSTKGIISDDIANSITYIPPRQKPFEAINTMLNRAVATSSATHTDMILFETVDGYNLRSINKLVTQDPQYTYKFGRLNRQSDESPIQDEFEVIGNYQIVQESAPALSVATGAYGCTMGVYDPITRSYKESTYDIIENKSDFDYLGDHLRLPGNDIAQKSSKDSIYKYVIKGTKGDSYLHRNAKFEQLFNNVKIVADVAGNSRLRVGQVILLETPSNNTDDISKHIEERFLKGKYLISSLKHAFKVGIGGYRTVVELVKDSIDIPLEDSEQLFNRISVKNVV